MKQLLILTLLVILALSVSACGRKGDVNPPATQSNNT